MTRHPPAHVIREQWQNETRKHGIDLRRDLDAIADHLASAQRAVANDEADLHALGQLLVIAGNAVQHGAALEAMNAMAYTVPESDD